LGILHRDIKPSNLLLDAYGTLWVTDFGLAKAEGADELTSPGDIVGTLRYMAPERFQGVADPRSDVYSLGLTLYEMVTLEPAFARSDRQRLIQEVFEKDPTPPCKIDRCIPRDLETIVLKAIHKEPDRRYSSAGELARDLKRFLDDRPLLARRTSWAGQIQRWRRRNPIVASLAASITILLLMAAVGAAAAAHYFRELAHREERARGEAEQLAREIAESLEQQTRFYRMLQSGQNHLAQAHLAQSHADYSEAIRLRPDNPAAWSGRSLLYNVVGMWDAAGADLKRSFQLLPPGEVSHWFSLAALPLAAGDDAGYQRTCVEAERLFGAFGGPRNSYWVAAACTLGPDACVDPEYSIHLAERALASNPQSQEYLSLLGRAHYRAGQWEQAMHRLQQHTAQDTGWDSSEAWPVLAMTCHRLGRDEEARYWLEKTRRSLDEITRVIAQEPFSINTRFRGDFELIALYLLYREAQTLLEPQPQEHPIRWVIQGRGCTVLGMQEQAVVYLTRAIELRPEDRNLRMARWQYLARCGQFRDAADDLQVMLAGKTGEPWDWYCYALLRLEGGDADEHRRACERMKLLFHEPGHWWQAQQLALICSLAPDAHWDGEWESRLAEQALQADSKYPWFVLTAALVRLRGGRFSEAVTLLNQAQDAAWPNPRVQESGKAIVAALLSRSYFHLGRNKEARRWFEQSARSLEQFQPQEDTGDWGPAWHAWLMCRILLRETEPLIAGGDGGARARDGLR
jgi:Flp pilus assembly protein TadD